MEAILGLSFLLWFLICVDQDFHSMLQMMCPDPFDDLLKTVIMNDQLACDPDVGGCGKPNPIHHILSSSPHVFTVGKLLSL